MIPYSFLHLDPVSWKQSLHTERGAAFSVNGRISTEFVTFLISDVGDIGGLHTELTFVRGPYDWKIPEGPPGSLGFLAYHPEDQHSEGAFLSGGCSIKDDLYEDAWHRIRASSYDSCYISLEVAPIEYDGEDTLWNRKQSKFLYLQQVELVFVRKEKEKPADEPRKRGLFG